ncbi:MAG: hypothetical protein R8G60_13960 [Roseovarius pacificus]|nr:hypothetical protein [Roseovarius pacificus]
MPISPTMRSPIAPQSRRGTCARNAPIFQADHTDGQCRQDAAQEQQLEHRDIPGQDFMKLSLIL